MIDKTPEEANKAADTADEKVVADQREAADRHEEVAEAINAAADKAEKKD